MSPAPNMDVTWARREVIVSVLVELGPSSASEVCKALLERIERKEIEWPVATWAGAKKDPYVLGIAQHLDALSVKRDDEQLVKYEGRNPRLYEATATNLRKRADEVLALKVSRQLNAGQIAEELGISPSLAHSLLTDPTGEKERKRKRGYCAACGAKKRQEAETCEECLHRKASELLPPDTFEEVAREYERRTGYALIFGVTPGMRRVIRVCAERGFLAEHEVRSDQTWEQALEEAELL